MKLEGHSKREEQQSESSHQVHQRDQLQPHGLASAALHAAVSSARQKRNTQYENRAVKMVMKENSFPIHNTT